MQLPQHRYRRLFICTPQVNIITSLDALLDFEKLLNFEHIIWDFETAKSTVNLTFLKQLKSNTKDANTNLN